MTSLAIFLIFICVVLLYSVLRLLSENKSSKLNCRKAQKEGNIIVSFLQEIGTVFTEAIDLDGLLNSVVHSTIQILKAKSGAIFLIDETRTYLQAAVIEGTFPPWFQPEESIMEKVLSKNKYLEEYLKAQKIPCGSGVIGSIVTTGTPCLISNAWMDSRIQVFKDEMLEIETMLLAPLKIRENILGVIVLVNKENDVSFTETDMRLLQALGDLSSIAIRNARFYKTILEKQKLDHDLSIASDIQQMLFPRKCPVVRNLEIGVLNKTAMEIGGDYYDFIEVGKDMLGVVIADVSGKSIPGALVMSMTRSIIRSKAIGVHSASSVLISANELICHDIEQDMFISLLYLIVNTSSNIVTCARAGHEPLIHYHAKDSVCELIGPEGVVLGMDSGPTFNNSIKEIKFGIQPGDVLVLYTDGITEAVNEKNEEFGIANLMDAVKIASGGSADDIVQNISERISRFTGSVPQKDDLTLVVLKVK